MVVYHNKLTKGLSIRFTGLQEKAYHILREYKEPFVYMLRPNSLLNNFLLEIVDVFIMNNVIFVSIWITQQKKLRMSKLDQENVSILIEKWQKTNLGDLFFFQPYGTNISGDSTWHPFYNEHWDNISGI